ncbi:hypothetical protein OCQ_27680 [Mycobacterium paraintracellulare]|nr:hypothetical protein OCQ_27680 [Mycobacterium paraintracellulare]
MGLCRRGPFRGCALILGLLLMGLPMSVKLLGAFLKSENNRHGTRP